jgi:hypothetical protein
MVLRTHLAELLRLFLHILQLPCCILQLSHHHSRVA